MKKFVGSFCLFATVSLSAFGNSGTLTSELKELRAEKRRIANYANELGALARNQHLTSWETHAIALSSLKTAINASAQRLARLQASEPSLPRLAEVRNELAAIAAQVSELKLRLSEDRLTTRTPSYYNGVMKIVASAERSEDAAEKLLASARNASPASQTGAAAD